MTKEVEEVTQKVEETKIEEKKEVEETQTEEKKEGEAS